MIFVGLDNGVSGGMVALSDLSQVVSMSPMPTLKARKGNEIDIAAVWAWVDGLDSREKITAVIEEPGGSKSALAASSMAGSFHALRALWHLERG